MSRTIRSGVIIVCGWLLAVVAASAAGASEWVQTWGAAPQPPTPAMGPFPATPSFRNQTIRQVVRVSLGGPRMRIRLTNEYGRVPLVVGAASVALADDKGNQLPGTEHPIHFSGQSSTSIPAGAPFVSDPIDLPVRALAAVSVSLYLPEDTGQCTCHQTGMQNAVVSGEGDFTNKPLTPQSTTQVRAFISGVDVEVPRGRSVVVLGDSISDGIGSSVDKNHRWPDLLATRLSTANAAVPWGVVNMGISGNQVLSDGAGQSALARFDRDVLSTPGVKAVILFEGVNDLGLAFGTMTGPMAELFKSRPAAQKLTAESMISGYRQLIARAHGRGIKVIGATITPYEGALYYSTEGEKVRQVINTWIRASHEFDGVIDFDAVLRDPAKPTQIREGLHMGDHLHGSDAGYDAMANAVDLSLLR